jgi:hypothetical protein
LLSSTPPGLFARGKALDAQAQARDHAGARSGMEPLTPTLVDGAGRVTQSDPRAPKSVSRAVRAEAA